MASLYVVLLCDAGNLYVAVFTIQAPNDDPIKYLEGLPAVLTGDCYELGNETPVEDCFIKVSQPGGTVYRCAPLDGHT